MLRRARELRSTMTRPEWTLWQMLRRSQTGLRFRREHPIGSYVLDFYCPSARVCVEVDGPAHLEPEQIEHDARRDAWLLAQGVTVLRFTADDVDNRPAAVLARIQQAAPPPPASPVPPPRFA
jgi:very-short-patch-repair endonuclease